MTSRHAGLMQKTQTSLFAHTHTSPHRKSDPRVRLGKPPWVPDPRVVTRQKSVPAIERPRQGPCLVADVTTHLAHARRCLSPFLPPPLAPSPPRRSSPRLPPRFVSFRVFLASSSVFSRGNRGPSRWRGRSTPPARAARDGVRVPSPGRPRWMDRRRDARSDARMD